MKLFWTGLAAAVLAGGISAAENEREVYEQAVAAFKAKEFPQAIESFSSVLSGTTNRVLRQGALLSRGNAYYVEQDYAAAMKDYETLLAEFPQETDTDHCTRLRQRCRVYLANASLRKLDTTWKRGDYAEVEKLGEQFLKNWAEFEQCAEVEYQLAQSMLVQRQYEEAVRRYAAFIEKYPEHAKRPVAEQMLGECHLFLAARKAELQESEAYEDWQKGRYLEAIEGFRKCAANETTAWFLAESLRLTRDPGAQQAYADFLKQYPQSVYTLEALLRQADLVRETDPRVAASAYRRVSKESADRALQTQAHLGLAHCSIENEDWREAELALLKAELLYPRSEVPAEVLSRLSYVAAKQGKTDLAARYLKRAQTLHVEVQPVTEE